MRVIAGVAKSLPLKTIEGLDTRPTTDRIKETLFNMLQSDIADSTFLDLFSGSGGIGIEALSRGAKKAVFIDNNKKAVKCIEDNLKFTNLYKDGIVLFMDVIPALKKINGTDTFDFIFMDPPYGLDCEEDILKYLSTSSLLKADSLLIIESALDKEFLYLNKYGYELVKEKKYKTNKHVFLICKMEEN